MSPFEIVSVALGLSTISFGVIGWFLNKLIDQHKAFNEAKEETIDTKFEGLIQRLDDLVKQISHLFQDQEIVTESMGNLSERVNKVEKKQGEQFVLCNERQRVILELKNKQDTCLQTGGRRTYDPPSDRIDRES